MPLCPLFTNYFDPPGYADVMDKESKFSNFLSRSRSRSRSKPDMQPAPGSKPASRIQSRPLSTTSPRPSSARQKLSNFFSRASSSRSRSRSRPSSPRPSLDVPPLPTDDPTPRSRRSHSPTPVLRVTNPTTSSTSTAASQKISKLFSAKPDPPAYPSIPPALPPIPSFVSAPIKRVSSLHRHSIKDPPPSITPKTSNIPKPSSTSSRPPVTRNPYHAPKASVDSSYRYRAAHMSVLDEESQNSAPSHKPNPREREPTSTSTAGHDPPTLIPRPGHKLSASTRATRHGSFDFERPGWGPAAIASPPIQRAGSNGTTNSAWSKNSETPKERDSTYGPGLAGVGTLQRELSMKRLQEREDMLKMNQKPRTEPALHKGKERSSEKDKDPASSSQRTTPDHAQNSTSTTGKSNNSKGTGRRTVVSTEQQQKRKTALGTGVTRLLGLKPSQHPPFSFEPPVPSPTWSTGTASTGVPQLPLSTSKAEKERERLRDEKDRLLSRKAGGGGQRRGDRPAVPVPAAYPYLNTYPAAHPTSGHGNGHGHRSGTKGRSLDLGLGLAWAPSKVREEALLPSSAFFARTMSGASASPTTQHAMARTTSGSTTRSANGRSRAVGDADLEDRDLAVERSKLGREVAEMFKTALDHQGYKLFRTYVHQFDAHEIPFDGPTGIVTRVEHLLVSAPRLGNDGKNRLLDKFVRILLQQT